MKPILNLPPAEARQLSGLFFDLDDTFLDHTQLNAEAYAALYALRSSGLRLIALTGRPASWAEMIVRMWPVEAAIAENGSLAYTLEGRIPRFMDSVASEVRRERRAKLADLVAEVQRAVPGLVPANDVHGRMSDYTFDIGETQMAPEAWIQEAMHLARHRGARTTRSSVHLHLTFDFTDKGTGALHLLRQLGHDPTSARRSFAFIGDSDNDAAAFATFHTSVGVSNLRGRFSSPPRYITNLPKSAGFCQFADHLIQLRRP
jgi:HAD superfamily hydrolase (TIGR01484 family)